MKHHARRFASALVAIAGAGTIAVTVLALVPVFPCSLLEHFRVQVAIGGVLVVAAAAALRMPRVVDATAIATLVTAIAIVPDLTAARRPVPAGTHVRLLSANVLTRNARHADVAALIARERPDVVALVEVDQRWLDRLEAALAGYARVVAPRDDNFGVALYARGEVRGEVRELANRTPNVFAEVTVDGATFRVVVVHPIPPMTARLDASLDAYFAELGALVRADPRVIVAGDFNATPWSRPFHRMIAASELCDSRAGFGMQASFPASSVLLRIPIDHVLVACGIGVRDRRIGPDVGSDHRPVLVDLVLP